METWYRVFGAGDQEPAPETILQHLNGFGPVVTARFGADEAGWFYADLRIGDEPLHIDRYRAEETGIRAELNSWAAWVESLDADAELMERFIQTQQLFTFRAPSSALHSCCLAVAEFLARATDGLYQIDSKGLFDADGKLLLAE